METISADPLLVALCNGGRCAPDQLRLVEQAFSSAGSEFPALADSLQALGVLITAYFPEEETPVHHNPALSATARAIASGIRMSLPPAPVSK